MKRLHIVGKSKDNKRLYLARAKDAKFGSFEIPIGRKLLSLVEQVQEERAARGRARAGGRRAPEGDRAAPAAAAEESPPKEATEQPPERARSEPDGRSADGRDERTPAPAGDDEDPRRKEWIGRRTERPEIPERSKLTPAEIQALIRAGRGVRSVARMAGTPQAWVSYLAEPIRQERRGVVAQMLRLRQARARLGPSAEPIGESVLQNLRDRRVSDPERVVDEGFTAFRPDSGPWRVRLAFEHRGRRHIAHWRFEPQSGDVVPLNQLATRLGWRRDDESRDGAPPARRNAPRSQRSGTARTPGRRRAGGTRSGGTRRKRSGRA